MPKAKSIVALVTAPVGEAEAIAAAIVERRLAACVNVVPRVRSIYRWEGEIQRDDEGLLVVKTTAAALAALERLLDEIHPYDTFELVAVDITAGSLPYLAWLSAAVDVPRRRGPGA